MESKAKTVRPHAVVTPLPFQGHLKGMLKFAKLLHYKGFYITFVNTDFNHKRLLKSGGPHSLDGLPNFQFETIPDGLPQSDIDAPQDKLLLCQFIMENFLPRFRDLLAKLNNSSSSNIPLVTSIVSDGMMAMVTAKAAEEIGVPVVMTFTLSACGLMGFKQLQSLREKGFNPPIDKSYLDTILDWIPGMKYIRLKDLPFAGSRDPSHAAIIFSIESVENAVKAPAIVVHTFEALEKDVLDGLSSMYRHVYAIGPFQLLLNQIQDDDLKSIGYSLWKEESECLQWLDAKEPNSVVYVNFGSIAVITEEQLIEFAMGLANSNHAFLWILRPDLVIGNAAILPAEFATETGKRGFITSWCPQEEVLNHPSVGGFLTHSGWNSTIESLGAGVPMICWPLFADQQMNCRYSCTEWGVGMEMDNNAKREEVENLVKELMEGEKGKKMRKKAMEWKRLAEEATARNGSSSINLEKLVNEVLSSKY